MSSSCHQSRSLKNIFNKSKLIRKLFLHLLLISSILFLSSCSSSKKFTSDESTTISKEIISALVRLLMKDNFSEISFTAETSLKASDKDFTVARIKKGSKITITNSGVELQLIIDNRFISGEEFRFTGENSGDIFSFNNKKYRGTIAVNSKNQIINILPLEDYLKGVVPAEMPIGSGTEYFEALKAQAICARTYTLQRLNKDHDFDLHIDVRDQVYKGVDAEREISGKAVDETSGMVLTYKGELCTIYYSSTCGGYTEAVENVFSSEPIPYLKSIKDGKDFYCSASPHFNWIEKFPEEEFVKRFVDKGLLPSYEYKLNSISVNSRFYSGRVNELELNFKGNSGTDKSVKIYGNQIRSIIRNQKNTGILRSVMIDFSFDGDTITIKGKGSGHGVGMCQWGAMVQSKEGRTFRQILSHYFLGT